MLGRSPGMRLLPETRETQVLSPLSVVTEAGREYTTQNPTFRNPKSTLVKTFPSKVLVSGGESQEGGKKSVRESVQLRL